jgi:hypothetical protein
MKTCSDLGTSAAYVLLMRKQQNYFQEEGRMFLKFKKKY